MKFKTKNEPDYTLIEFLLDNTISPEDLRNLSPPDLVKANLASKGVVLSGRGPIWLYGYLVHYYHPTKFIATYDPRLGGAVVVQSHDREYNVGDVISINE